MSRGQMWQGAAMLANGFERLSGSSKISSFNVAPVDEMMDLKDVPDVNIIWTEDFKQQSVTLVSPGMRMRLYPGWQGSGWQPCARSGG